MEEKKLEEQHVETLNDSQVDISEQEEEITQSDFQKKVAALSDRTWNIVQYVGGALLGIAVAFCIFGTGGTGFESMFTLLAALLAIFIPRYLEQNCGRELRRCRIVMVITLVIAVIVEFILISTRNGSI